MINAIYGFRFLENLRGGNWRKMLICFFLTIYPSRVFVELELEIHCSETFS